MLDLNLLDLEDLSEDETVIEMTEMDEETPKRDVAIIGMSARYPKSEDLAAFWDSLKQGMDAVGAFPQQRKQDIEAYLQQLGYDTDIPFHDGAYLDEISQFDPSFFKLSPKEAELMNPNQRIFLEMAWRAVENAGYGAGQLKGSNTGVYIGYTADMFHDYKKYLHEMAPDFASMAIPGNLTSVIAGRISYWMDLKGPAVSMDTACSSSLVAIYMACQAIRNGDCDMALAGSVKTLLAPIDTGMRIGIEASDARAKPFDAHSDGTGMGEGAACLLLKPLDLALEDRDHIYAVIKGGAINQDGSSVGITAPNVEAQEKVIVSAWKDAEIDPETVGYIEAHGTGTKLGDPIEIEGVTRAFRRFTNKTQFCSIGSVKSNLGHLDNAAGVTGVVKAVMAVKEGWLPPSLHFQEPNPAISFLSSPVYVQRELEKWTPEQGPRTAGVSSFGMSGTNCHLVVQEPPQQTERSEDNDGVEDASALLVLTAPTLAGLQRLVQDYADQVDLSQHRLSDICYTASTGRNHYRFRLAASVTRQTWKTVLHEMKQFVLEQLAARWIQANELDQGNSVSPVSGVVRVPAASTIYFGEVDAGQSVSNYSIQGINDTMDQLGDEACRQLAEAYASGVVIPWKTMYEAMEAYRVPLPPTPLERVRLWLDGQVQAKPQSRAIREGQSGHAEASDQVIQMVHVKLTDASTDDSVQAWQQLVANVWGEVLGFDQLSARSNYYELGGDSILALRIVQRLEQAAGVKLPVAVLIEKESIEQLAAYLHAEYGQVERRPAQVQRQDAVQTDRILPAAASHDYKLTPSQQRVFIQEQLAGISTSYNMPQALWLKGQVDVKRLETGLLQLIQRHEALRTSFSLKHGLPVQHIQDAVSFQMECELEEPDSQLPHPSAVQTIRDWIRPFSLAEAPLFRAKLKRWDAHTYLLMTDMHHLIGDGASSALLLAEWMQLYAGNVLPAVPVQFKDFAVWQQQYLESEELETQQQYWLKQFAGELPVLELETDFPRQAERSFEGDTHIVHIDASQLERVKVFAQAANASLHSALLSMYAYTLMELAEQKEVIMGSIVSGRHYPDVQQTVGMFINYLPIRLQQRAKRTAKTWTRAANQTLLEAYQHQDIPFEQLIDVLEVETSSDRNPLYDTMLVFHNEHLLQEANGLQADGLPFTVELVELPLDTATLDLKLDVILEQQGGCSFLFNYNRNLFTAETVEWIAKQFFEVMEAFVQGPDEALKTSVQLEPIASWHEKRKSSSKIRKENGQAAVRMAVSASFTADPIVEPLQWWAALMGYEVSVEMAPYHQAFQELLNPQSLLSTNVGLNVLLLRLEDWVRDQELASEEAQLASIERTASELLQAIRQQHRSSPLLILTFPLDAGLSWSDQARLQLVEHYDKWMQELDQIADCYLIRMEDAFQREGVHSFYDAISDRSGHVPYTEEAFLVMAAEITRKLDARQRQPFKVIALDCDNTLWEGVCGESGLDVTITSAHQRLQQKMVDLSREGMMITLLSKNVEQDVWHVLDQHPDMILKREHLVGAKINWLPKSDNIKQLAKELNVGLDSFIFMDDNPMEISEMLANAPSVLSIPLPKSIASLPNWMDHIWALDRFSVTEEDRKRTSMMRAEVQRKEYQHQHADSLDDFLSSLDIVLDIQPLSEAHVPRASQLTMRTNQFNLSTIRRTEAEIEALQQQQHTYLWTIQVRDRFGDYGLVGLLIARQEEQVLHLDTFLMSCRVLGRKVEVGLLSFLKEWTAQHEVDTIQARFVPTAKNVPFKQFLEETNWLVTDETSEYVDWKLSRSALPDAPAQLTIHSGTSDRNQAKEQVAETSAVYAFSRLEEGEDTVAAGSELAQADRSEPSEQRSPQEENGTHFDPAHAEINHADDLIDPHWMDEYAGKVQHDRQYWPLAYASGSKMREAYEMSLASTSSLPETVQVSQPVTTERSSSPSEEPVTEMEKELATLWSSVLRANVKDRHAHFFRSGGNSLKAVQLISRIHQQLGLELSIPAVFQYPTLTEMAALLAQQSHASSAVSIDRAEDRDDYPVTSAQRRMVMLQQFASEATSINIPMAVKITGQLDVQRLHHAIHQVIARHEALRTRFAWKNGALVQHIADQVSLEFPVRQEQAPYSEEVVHEQLRSFIRPFQVEEGPLFRCALIQFEACAENGQTAVLMLDVHHSIADGVSLAVLYQDLVQLYQNRLLEPLSIQYKDFAVWLQNEMKQPRMQEQKQYWLDHLTNYQPFALATSGAQSDASSHAGERIYVKGDPDLADVLSQTAEAWGSTVNSLLLSGLYVHLAQQLNRADLVIGMPTAGRNQAQLDSLVGMFVNTLPLRQQLSPDHTFDQLVSQVQSSVEQALQNQMYPYEEMVQDQAVGGHTPALVSGLLVMQNMEWGELSFAGMQWEPVPVMLDNAMMDFTLQASQAQDGAWTFMLEYRSAVWSHGEAVQWLEQYLRTLTELLKSPSNLPIPMLANLQMSPEKKPIEVTRTEERNELDDGFDF
ncbi:HAD-IIIC family phosphatase [Marinicrinis sediminis]|uniref:HAD-IIIC family phosphatase n=1 Tax=Marinicrinis sediminis TaxID=1652465 RepID=A0ABW5RDF0_9BACL